MNMKIACLLLCLVGFACVDQANTHQNVTATVVTVDSPSGFIQIVTIDGCEYVFMKSGNGGGLAHKGNCRNHLNR